MQNRKMGCFLATIMTILMAACGGGGGSSDGPVASTATFQTRTALSNSTQDTQSHPFQVSGTISGINVAGSGIVTESPMTPVTFEGQSALQKFTTITMEITGNGQTRPLSSSDASYFDADYEPLGYGTNGDYTVVSNVTIPDTARINDTGTLYTANIYLDSSKTTLLGTETASYLLAPDTSSTALLKVTKVERDTSGNTVSTSTATYRITPAGDITLISENIQLDGDVLNITY